MRTRKIALFTALALAGLPAGALAAGTSHPATPANTNANSHANGTSTTDKSSSASSNPDKDAAKVLFVIHGTVTAYTAANGATNGSISITFKSSNHESGALKGATQPLTFMVSSSTKVVLHDDKAIASGDTAAVKVRAAKNASVATLETTAAFQVVDQGQ